MLAESGSTWHTLLTPADWAMVLVICAVTLPCIIIVIVYYWYVAKKARIDADLKHAMIEKGMSAEDIERILQAKSADPASKGT